MAGENQSGMQCVEVEALLAEALDGTLQGSQLTAFEAHQRGCASCRSVVEEARAGMHWLKGLDEAEPPRNLVHNILAQTIGALPSEHAIPVAPSSEGWVNKLKARLAPIFAPVATPRFAMSFGMAFFALSVSLTVAGVKPRDVLQISLRPSAIRRTYYNTQARVVRYVDNVRPVLEVQAALRGIKRNINPAEPGPSKQQKERKNDTTQQPEQKQDRNYSQMESHFILASAPLGPSVFDRLNPDPLSPDRFNPDPLHQDLPVVSVTTYRRFV